MAIILVLRVERVREEMRWRRERGAWRRVDLVEEAAEAPQAEDVGGRVGDDAKALLDGESSHGGSRWRVCWFTQLFS